MEPSRDDQFFTNVCNMVFILIDLGLEALESNNFTEKRSVGKFGSLSFGFPNSPRFVGEKKTRCKMFHVNRLLLPIHRENGVSSKISRVNGISGRGFALYETKTQTFTQGHPCRNRRLGFFPCSSPKLRFLHLWAQNCGSKGGSPF